MAKRKSKSKMSAKARMAYVRSFIGKKRGKRGGSLKEQMDYVRSFRGLSPKKSKKGGRFPKGTLSEWKAKAKRGDPVYKRAIANWNKLMSKSGFKEKWNANKIRRGGALEDNIDYRQLIGMYQNRNFGGAGIRGYGIRGYGIKSIARKINPRAPGTYNDPSETFYNLHRLGKNFETFKNGGALPRAYYGVKGKKYVKSGAGIRGYGIRGYGYVPGKGLIDPKTAKKFDKIFDMHMRQARGVTKRDLYKGAGKQNSLFYTRNRMLKRQGKKPMTIMTPDDEMVELYRGLYARSGIHPENMIDPIVRNDRLKGGNILKKPVRFIRKHKVASTAASFIPGPAGVAARIGARALGAGLVEEAGINGRGHPDYIYH